LIWTTVTLRPGASAVTYGDDARRWSRRPGRPQPRASGIL